MPRRTHEAVPLEPTDAASSVPIDKKIGRQIDRGYWKFAEFFDKKSSGFAIAGFITGVMIPVSLVIWNSDWNNIGQKEHRQIMAEIARPYIALNKALRPYSGALQRLDGLDGVYMLQTGSFNWTTCLWACYQGGRLPASIHFAKEEQYIQNFVRKANKGDAWFGLAILEDEEWKNLDDSPVDFENWADGEPSNKSKKQFCAQMSSSSQKWQAVECDKILNLCVCKNHANTCLDQRN